MPIIQIQGTKLFQKGRQHRKGKKTFNAYKSKAEKKLTETKST